MANVQGTVLGSGLASTNVAAANTTTNFAQGKQSEALYSEVHGKYYAANYAGNVFQASTAAAGTIIPAFNTTAATFAIYNPIGSGVNMELIQYNTTCTNATAVVDGLGLGIATGLTVAPTGLTALTSLSLKLGGGNVAVGKVYSVATIVATTSFFWMMGYSAATGAFPQLCYPFDGQVILTPGTLAHVVGSTTVQSSASVQTIVWSEWLA